MIEWNMPDTDLSSLWRNEPYAKRMWLISLYTRVEYYGLVRKGAV